MINPNDPRLSILNVAYICNISYIPEGKRFTSTCPFCGAALGHFYLTPKDGRYTNVFRCVKCGEHGNQYKLYAYMKGFLNDTEYNKRACKELMGFDVETDTIKSIKQAKEASNIKLNQMATIEIRDKVYRSLIRKLSLSEKHYLNLKHRGLSNNDILRNGYKTLPFDKELKNKICKELTNYGFVLAGVPGFYTDKNMEWTFWTPKEGGFLVPVINSVGQVQGCQVRKDALKKKYTWFSSSYMKNGAQCNGFIHVHWNPGHSSKKVVITEGALKATIASILSDTTFIAVPGINAIECLPEILSELKPEKLYVAYDMDYIQNKYVEKALNKLKWNLRTNGFNAIQSNWNPQYKGIDDYMLHVTHIKEESIALER